MTPAANAFLRYLDRYLKANPAERKKLISLHRKHTGRELRVGHLWKHTARKVEPGLSTALVYLVFLSKARALKPSKIPGEIFTYQNPEWLKA